jgi:branched-chain amino acid transport system ATP-binding protein
MTAVAVAAVLRADSLSLSYGNAATALVDVSLEVQAGSIVAVLGANGAGKTSLVRALTGQAGFYGARVSGSISYGEQRLLGLDTAAMARMGLVQVPEGRKLFGMLTVLDNLQCGAASQRGMSRQDRAAKMEWVFDIFPRLRERRHQLAGTLSGGEQQMVAIGRALMSRPKVLLCDELSLGLAPLAVQGIYDTLFRLNRSNDMSLVIIEQNAREALRMATYAYVLEVGHVVAHGTSAELMRSGKVERYYLGG